MSNICKAFIYLLVSVEILFMLVHSALTNVNKNQVVLPNVKISMKINKCCRSIVHC